jgi:hypothetical protein
MDFLLLDGRRHSPLRNGCLLCAVAIAALGYFSFSYYSRARFKGPRAGVILRAGRITIALSDTVCAMSLLGCVFVGSDAHPSANGVLRVLCHISLFLYHLSLDVMAAKTKRSVPLSVEMTAVAGVLEIVCGALNAFAHLTRSFTVHQIASAVELLAIVALHFKFIFAGLLLVGPAFLPGMTVARKTTSADIERLWRASAKGDGWA